MSVTAEALAVLEATSRTFYIPISRLPAGLQEAVASAYLCMRAIDEIEDHPTLDGPAKAVLLQAVSRTLQAPFSCEDFAAIFAPYRSSIPEVTLRVGEWALCAPEDIAPRIWDATAAMSDRMAAWSLGGFRVETEADLDRYTFGVAGAVGLLLSDLWQWFDTTRTNRQHALGFGRGLQAVNILRNHGEDLGRGVDFFPDGWDDDRMQAYARRNLTLADAYLDALPPGPAREFCTIPLTLAHATLDVMARGEAKLSRGDVLQLIGQATSR
ncbi:MAG TPA: phytoene/squalene synthase family protein [Chloroflexota bacterium]|nr:phytoene/squalene synthase family protein [Chloroflexota bacterium]